MLNVNTTKITIVDETRECLSRQMMLTYSSYRDNTPTHTHTNPQTGPITIHCATASLAHSVITMFYLSHSLCNLQGEYANMCQEFFFFAATSTIQTICMCITQQWIAGYSIPSKRSWCTKGQRQRLKWSKKEAGSLSQSKAKCPSPEFFIFVFDLKMASFDALLVVFYEI